MLTDDRGEGAHRRPGHRRPGHRAQGGQPRPVAEAPDPAARRAPADRAGPAVGLLRAGARRSWTTATARTWTRSPRTCWPAGSSVLDLLGRDPCCCADQLDWVAKLRLLEGYREREKLELGLAQAAAGRPAVQRRAPGEGPVPPAGRPRGDADAAVDDEDVATAMSEPPEDTRAYFRGRCLAQYAPEVVAASWDSVIFDVGRESLVRVPMMEPERGTKAHVGAAVRPLPQRQGPAGGHHRRLTDRADDRHPRDHRGPRAIDAPVRHPSGLARAAAERFCRPRGTLERLVGGGRHMATRDTGGQSQSGKARRDEEIDEAPAPEVDPRGRRARTRRSPRRSTTCSTRSTRCWRRTPRSSSGGTSRRAASSSRSDPAGESR